MQATPQAKNGKDPGILRRNNGAPAQHNELQQKQGITMELLHILILIVSFVFLLFLGVPISFSIGIAAISTMLLSIKTGPALTTIAQRMATGLDSFALLAIPFFILSALLMNLGGIARRLRGQKLNKNE